MVGQYRDAPGIFRGGYGFEPSSIKYMGDMVLSGREINKTIC
jgi:hypothetical protein